MRIITRGRGVIQGLAFSSTPPLKERRKTNGVYEKVKYGNGRKRN